MLAEERLSARPEVPIVFYKIQIAVVDDSNDRLRLEVQYDIFAQSGFGPRFHLLLRCASSPIQGPPPVSVRSSNSTSDDVCMHVNVWCGMQYTTDDMQ